MGLKQLQQLILSLLITIVLLITGYLIYNANARAEEDTQLATLARLKAQAIESEEWHRVPVGVGGFHPPTTNEGEFMDACLVEDRPAVVFTSDRGVLVGVGKTQRQKVDENFMNGMWGNPIWWYAELPPGRDQATPWRGPSLGISGIGDKVAVCTTGSPAECYEAQEPDLSGTPVWGRTVYLPKGTGNWVEFAALTEVADRPFIAAITRGGGLYACERQPGRLGEADWERKLIAEDLPETFGIDTESGPGMVAICWESDCLVTCAAAHVDEDGIGQWHHSAVSAGYGCRMTVVGDRPLIAFYGVDEDKLLLARALCPVPAEAADWDVTTIKECTADWETPAISNIDGCPVVAFVERPDPDIAADDPNLEYPEWTGRLQLATAAIPDPAGPDDWDIEVLDGVFGDIRPKLMYSDNVLFIIYCDEFALNLKRRNIVRDKLKTGQQTD